VVSYFNIEGLFMTKMFRIGALGIGLLGMLWGMARGQTPSIDNWLGAWDIQANFAGRPMLATLLLSRKADGTLAGTWSGTELTNVKIEASQLTFTRDVRSRNKETTQSFTGQLQDGKLVGKLTTDQGVYPVTGERFQPKSVILGGWNLKILGYQRETTARLAITQTAEGLLQGEWLSRKGEDQILDLKCQNGKLSFKHKTKTEGQEREALFTGTVEDNMLTGTFKSGSTENKVQGTRVGAALVGAWDFGASEERGPRLLTVYGDLSGRYTAGGRDSLIDKIDLEGNEVSFTVERGYGELKMTMKFKGTLENNVLKGQFDAAWGSQNVTGKKSTPAP
jgi:hypothetical protein